MRNNSRQLRDARIHAKTADMDCAGLSVTKTYTPKKSALAEAVFFNCQSYRVLLPIISCVIPGLVVAAPEGGNVVAGSGAISNPNANTTLINQTTANLAIDWQRFNIGTQEYVQFAQPDANSVALNRVVGGDPSQILGNLSANGQVFLVNPNGVYFGQAAIIDVGGIVASVHDIRNEDFMSRNYVFSKADGSPDDVGIVNDGLIIARDGGYVALMGDYIHNNGIIQARLGSVALAVGNQITMDVKSNGLISVAVDGATLSDVAGIKNTGAIISAGGRVQMTARVASDLVDTAINNEGLVLANSISERNGVIFLSAYGGDVVNSGTLDASAEIGTGADGGGVLVYSDKNVVLTSNAVIEAKGDGDGAGGVALVIAEEVLDAQTGSRIDVSGADGKGGFVEVSGHSALSLRGDIETGVGGEILIDPLALSIANTNAVNGQPITFNVGNGVISVVGKGFIESRLDAGNNITLVASSAIGASSGTLGTNNFTLNTVGAGNLSIINGTVSGTGGTLGGSGTIFNCGGDGFCAGGFGTSRVIVNGGGDISLATVSFNLAGDFLAQAGNATGNATIGNISAGNVSVNAGGNVNLTNVNAKNGKVNINAGNSINVVNISATATPGKLAEIALKAGVNITQATGAVFDAIGGAAYITATAGGNVTFNGDALVTAIAGNRISLAGSSTQFGNVAKTGEAQVLIQNVGGSVAIGNVTAIATATGTTGGAAPILRGDAELEIENVGGNVSLTGTHTIKVGNGQAADADLQVRNVVGNVNYSGTANISGGTQGTGTATSAAGMYETTFTIERVGGNVTINGGGISVTGGANNGLGAGRFVAVDLDSIGGKLDINAPINVTAGNNRDAALDIDRIGGALNVVGNIANGTASFTFAQATAVAPCVGASCGDVNINAPVNISITNTAGAHSGSDARITVDDVFGNFTVNNTAPLTLTAGDGAGADASFDIGGGAIGATAKQGVRGNVVVNGDMLFTANSGNARDASIDFDFIGGNVSIGGNMTFNGQDDARVVMRQIGGGINVTGNALFTAGSGTTASAVYDLKRVKGDVVLGGIKTIIVGDDGVAGISVHDVDGNVAINNGATIKAGNRILGTTDHTDAEIDIGRVTGSVTVNGDTLLQAGNNAETSFNIHDIGGTQTSPLNAYDNTATDYVFTNGGCVGIGCGVTTVNGNITQNFNTSAGVAGALADADISFDHNQNGAIINGNIIAVSQTSLEIGARSVTGTGTAARTTGPVDLTLNGSIDAASNVSVDVSGNLDVNGKVKLTGSSLLLAAGSDVNLNSSLGSSAARMNANVTLRAGRHINIKSDIFLASNQLTLAADFNNSGIGDVDIDASGSFGSPKGYKVNTRGSMLISGRDVIIGGADGSSVGLSARTEIHADNDIIITANRDVRLQGGNNGFAGGTDDFDASAVISANNNITINATNLNVNAGRGEINLNTFSLNSSASGKANAEISAGNNITFNITNDLNLRAGTANATATNSTNAASGKVITANMTADTIINAGNQFIATVGEVIRLEANNATANATARLACSPCAGSDGPDAFAFANANASVTANTITINNNGSSSMAVRGGTAIANADASNASDVPVVPTTADARAQANGLLIATNNIVINKLDRALIVEGGDINFGVVANGGVETGSAVANGQVIAGNNFDLNFTSGFGRLWLDNGVTGSFSTEEPNSKLIVGGVANITAANSLTLEGRGFYDVGSALNFTAGNSNSDGILVRDTLGSSNARLDVDVTLSGKTVDIQEGIFLANKDLSIIAMDTGDGGSNAVVSMVGNSIKPVTISTLGNLNISADDLIISGTSTVAPNTIVEGNNVTFNINRDYTATNALVKATNNVTITTGTYTENANHTTQAGNNLSVAVSGDYNVLGNYTAGNQLSLSAGNNLTVDSAAQITAGAVMSLAAVNTLDLNVALGSVGSVLNNNVSLSGKNILIDNDIVLGNNTLTLSGQAGTGTISITGSSSAPVTVSTLGDMSITGNNLIVKDATNFTGGSGTLVASVNVAAANIDIELSGDMTIEAGVFNPSGPGGGLISVNSSVTATENISIIANSLTVKAGVVDATASINTTNVISANATLQADGDIVLELVNDLNIMGGIAGAEGLSGIGMTANADAEISAGGNLTITAANVNIAAGTETVGAGSGALFASAKARLSAGSALSVMASNNITGTGADISASGMYMNAVNNIDLVTSTVSIGNGTVDGVLGDAITLAFLGEKGIPLPTTPNPNAKFSAGGSLSLGTLTMDGDVPYLWLEADTTNIAGLELPEASDVVVQFSPFTLTADIGVESSPNGNQTVNYNNLEHFSILPGTTVIIGSSVHTGKIILGDLGNVDIGSQNFVAVTSSEITSINNILSTGIVAELLIGQSNDFVTPVLTDFNVFVDAVDNPFDDKDKKKNLVKDDEEEINMCEAS